MAKFLLHIARIDDAVAGGVGPADYSPLEREVAFGDGSFISLSYTGAGVSEVAGVSGLRKVLLNDLLLEHRTTGRSCEITIPWFSTTRIFWLEFTAAITVSNDLRLLTRGKREIDPVGLCKLLEFGTIAGDSSLLRDVRAFLPGRRYKIGPGKDFSSENLDLEFGTPSGNVEHQLKEDFTAGVGEDHGEQSLILFSGGVDSSLIAARRLESAGRNPLLVNLSFGNDDPEALVARKVAAELGLELHQIEASTDELGASLGKWKESYGMPIGDTSLFPTSLLASKVCDEFGSENRLVFDGTGADGVFGLWHKGAQWQRYRRLLELFSGMAGGVYRNTPAWRTGGHLEYVLRQFRRSSLAPYPWSVMLNTTVSGILFKFEKEQREKAIEELDELFSAPAIPDSCLLPFLDVVMICCGIFAQKVRLPFDATNMEVRYPFLKESLITRAWSVADPARLYGDKRILKEWLKDSVPASLIERPKSGFIAPMWKVMAQPEVLRELDRICSGESAIAEVLCLKEWQRVFGDIRRGTRLPVVVYQAISTVLATEMWVRSGSCVER